LSTQSISAPTVTGSELEGATREQLAAMPVPPSYRAAFVSVDDENMFGDEADRDVRRSIKVDEVPMPELAPDEVLVAVMASAINYNTVWSARFEPVPTFRFLERLGRQGGWNARHDLPHHVLGSDAAGIVVRVGSVVRRWLVGDRVVVSTGVFDEQDPISHVDAVLSVEQRAWGYETNFGGLAHYTVVKATQLLPKPAHLSWEEAACNTLCAMTAYRMLVSDRGARLKQGDITLIWGATGGVGAYAVQFVRNGGGIAVGVVNSERKARLLQALGCDVVLRRDELGLDELGSGAAIGKRVGGEIRRQLGEDPNIVVDYIGRSTFEASVYLVRRGGVVVTCGSSTGYRHEFDNRLLWMRLKRIIGCHGADWAEAWESNRLIDRGMIVPALSRVMALDETGEAARFVQLNRHVGKVGILCLAEAEGLGVEDPARREAIGESRLRLFREQST
jgi:crotonyl-CoA reductase